MGVTVFPNWARLGSPLPRGSSPYTWSKVRFSFTSRNTCLMVDGSPTRLGTGTARARLPAACFTSPVPQPFCLKTTEVHFLTSRSEGRVNRVSEPVVPWVPWPLAGVVLAPALKVSSGPRASMPRVLVTTTLPSARARSAG